jgi:replication-associated recombination protein RarA
VDVLQTGFGKDGKVASPLTPRGYYLDEVISALQKEIRRGKEYEAVYWAVELESFNARALWNRLRVIASEDVGVAEPHAPLIVSALESAYWDAKEKKKGESKLFVVNAVLILARAPKCRVADDLMITLYGNMERGERLEMPDYAIDKHTFRGRKKGRGLKHFVEEGSKIANEGAENPYKETAEKILLKGEETRNSLYTLIHLH